MLHGTGDRTRDRFWPALVLALIGLLAIAAGATDGEFTETVANGSAL